MHSRRVQPRRCLAGEEEPVPNRCAKGLILLSCSKAIGSEEREENEGREFDGTLSITTVAVQSLPVAPTAT